ncbi:MAG TPA: thiopeptide-type bacteriocin biosynthesis protein [Longimicrobium sp.]|nr:thiopeptide-type bacteriocin biosynthesis protein [Longimicrobium sp.]
MLQPWPEGSEWLAVHLFFNHPGIYTGECDGVVMELALPFVRRCQEEGWIDGHFFIRYSEHGPHVRLRLHGRTDVLEGTVWPALQEHVRAAYPNVSFEKPDTPQYGMPAEVPEGTPLEVTHAARIEYEPETDRYGGEQGVRVAERFFEVSSEAAYALLLRTSRTERSSRLGKGLLTMVQLVHVFTGGDREMGVRWAQQYNLGYLRGVAREEEQRDAWLGAFDSGYSSQSETLGAYVEEVWSRMGEGEPLSDALDLYSEGLLEVRGHLKDVFDAGTLGRAEEPFTEWSSAVMGVCSSYLHMMNNRLGITIQEESYLAYLITRTLQAPAPVAAEAEG